MNNNNNSIYLSYDDRSGRVSWGGGKEVRFCYGNFSQMHLGIEVLGEILLIEFLSSGSQLKGFLFKWNLLMGLVSLVC